MKRKSSDTSSRITSTFQESLMASMKRLTSVTFASRTCSCSASIRLPSGERRRSDSDRSRRRANRRHEQETNDVVRGDGRQNASLRRRCRENALIGEGEPDDPIHGGAADLIKRESGSNA